MALNRWLIRGALWLDLGDNPSRRHTLFLLSLEASKQLVKIASPTPPLWPLVPDFVSCHWLDGDAQSLYGVAKISPMSLTRQCHYSSFRSNTHEKMEPTQKENVGNSECPCVFVGNLAFLGRREWKWTKTRWTNRLTSYLSPFWMWPDNEQKL